jgi:diacylglycerol kinase (ATP)
MEKLKLIVNPASGKEDAVALLDAINIRLRRRFASVDLTLTVAEGDAEATAARALAEGCTHLVAVGGDGTLNGVLNGVGRTAALSEIVLGVIPAGTGNDFARALGLPDEPLAAAERLAAGTTRAIDVGVLNDRLFVNTSAGGLIAETSVRVDSGMKTLGGRIAYLVGGAQALLEHEPIELWLEPSDGPPMTTPTHTFLVSNSPYIGGGYRVAPDAALDDGLLDVCVIRATTMAQFVAVLARFAQGERLGEEAAVYARAARFEAATDRAIWVNTDGEPVEGDRFSYHVMPRAARFLV